MTIQPDELIEQNRRAWNEVAPKHAEQNLDRTKRELARGGAPYLDATFRRYLEELGLKGKTVAQLNCNNGRELLSAMQLGAARGLGFDISEKFIAQAKEINAECGLPAEFVETNVYEIPAEYDGVADVAFVTVGALCWMPDLRGYFDVVSRVLGDNGTLVVYETHPFLEMFKLDRECDPDEPAELHYPYFSTAPVVSNSGLDYYGDEVYGEEVVYWYHYNLSQILQSVIDAGFVVRRFQEFEHELDSGYRRMLELDVRPPMTFIVVAEKTA